MNIECLYVCIDELWLVDEKSSISFQPFFLDNIRLTLGNQPKIGLKIASIRETTNLNNKTDARKTFGMQSGNDIIELTHLDPIQNKMIEEYQVFKEILVRRINYYYCKEQLDYCTEDGHNFLSDDYIIKLLFKDPRNFYTLVDMSHGIPRNFINLLNTCLRKLDYNLSGYYIHYYLITEAVIDAYKKEHRSDLPLTDQNTVFNAISEYSRINKQYFFLIENRTVDRLKPELNSLLYKEIIHRIPSSETPLCIMNSHKAFYLDLGMYFLSIRESDYDEYERRITNFHLLLPEDLNENYKHYLLDLSNLSSEFVVCTQCSSVFLRTHPVFVKCKICPDCAAEIRE